MNRHLNILLSLVFVSCINHCCAQDLNLGRFGQKPVKKENVNRSQKKPVSSKSPVRSKTGSVNLTTNEDCSIKIGEKNYGILRRNAKMNIPLSKGTYLLTATSNTAANPFTTELNIGDSAVAVQVEFASVNSTANLKTDSIKAGAGKQNGNTTTSPPVANNVVPLDSNAMKLARSKATVDTLLMNMVSIAGGSFTMGYDLGDNDEAPEHTVNIRAFKFGKYEVTQQQWETIMGTNPSVNQGCASCPVENVSIADIDSFIYVIKKLTSKVVRLPSEAEWEYVAKKGGIFRDLRERAWFNSNAGKVTQPVGTKSANALGIFDMSGNVAEWCRDWYSSNYYKKKYDNNPAGPESGDKRIVRGGAFNDSENNLRPTRRDKQEADTRKKTIGFRLVMDVQ